MPERLNNWLRDRWWVLPALSGLLLVLTFHPFNLWPLGLVALAPLYAFAGAERSALRTFLGGALAGGAFSFELSYYTLMQFHWLPETYLFADLVRGASVPIALVGGTICGLALLLYRAWRGRSALNNALFAAAVYALAELLLRALFGGYYLAELGYVLTAVPPLLVYASVLGAPGLSFIVAIPSGWLAEAYLRHGDRTTMRAGAILLCAVAVVGLGAWAYLRVPGASQGVITLAIVQPGSRADASFGHEQDGAFLWQESAALAAAARTSPDLLIYPFSPVEGALWREEAPAFNKEVLVASEASVGRFEASLLPASTTLMTWNNLYAGGHFYNEYEFWKGGEVVSEYRKRHLFPFMDYTPAWAERQGFYTTPFDVIPGAADNRLVLNGLPLGDLMCSELHDASLARTEARRSPLIIAVGSEAMFLDDVASEFSLKAAQLRAAENDVAVVRGNVLGPSAIIDRTGRILSMVPAGQEGVAHATLKLSTPKSTLYNLLGDWPLLGILVGTLLCAWYGRPR